MYFTITDCPPAEALLLTDDFVAKQIEELLTDDKYNEELLFSRKRDQICPKSRFFRQCFAMFLSYEKIIATILSDFTGGYFNFCKLS